MSEPPIPPHKPPIEASKGPVARETVASSNGQIQDVRSERYASEHEALQQELLEKCMIERDRNATIESQLTAKHNAREDVQEKLTALLGEMLEHTLARAKLRSKLRSKDAQIKGLPERVRMLENEKTQADRAWVAEVVESSANQGTVNSDAPAALSEDEREAQIYNEGRNMGYLEAMRDHDLAMFQNGTRSEIYTGLKPKPEHKYVDDKTNPRCPHNRGIEIGKSLAGAWAADYLVDKTFDQRVYKVPTITKEAIEPYRTSEIGVFSFFAGLAEGREARCREIYEGMKDDKEKGSSGPR
ncbi:hypothetical protein FB567DRAFT_590166 [Paraphoma chrysanthemicola]|uniref:Uncharacterized protein n=1 Tax=Paraphoma chrysanthemicola TaxID=798071 RepID=A0A8K0W183_9PLEO|nr:hypothetical protein FB567DRAFT_590166 [Paraphoma chrysanthemicola]